MMRGALLVLAGLTAGFWLGWWMNGSAETKPAPAPAAVEPAAPARAEEAPARPAPARVAVGPAPAPAPAPAPVSAAEAADRAEMEALRTRLAALEKKLAQEEATRVAIEGKPSAMPADLPPRFAQETVHRAVDAALRQAQLDGQVTEVDCTEFPCLYIGELNGGAFDREASDRVRRSPALGDYKDDQQAAFGSTVGGADDKENPRRLFGVAIYPKNVDEKQRDEILKRLRVRWGDVADAARPVAPAKPAASP